MSRSFVNGDFPTTEDIKSKVSHDYPEYNKALQLVFILLANRITRA